MPVFVSTTFMPLESSIIEAVSMLKKYNIFNIELGSIHRPQDNLIMELNKLGCNYMTHNFFPPEEERLILNIASKNEDVINKSLDFIKNAIDFAIGIGAQIYTIHPGFLAEPTDESRSSDNFDFNFLPADPQTLSMEYDKCYGIFLGSLKRISQYIENKPIKIAIESEGSVSKKEFMFFSKPHDFSRLLDEDLSEKIGINLNLAHLNLAANAWGFDKAETIELLRPKIMAVEVSHNNGMEDDHCALNPGSWYMDILKDEYFKTIPVVFEGRNLAVDEVCASYKLLCKILGQSK